MPLSRLENVLKAVRHEEPEVIPNLLEFTDSANARRKFLASFGEGGDRETLAGINDYFDNFLVTVTRSGFLTRTVEDNPDYTVMEFETGGQWTIHHHPFWREYTRYPISDRADLASFRRPDPNDPRLPEGFAANFKINNLYGTAATGNSRYAGIAEDAAFFKGRGFFTTAEINGFFSGVWYFLRPFEEFLMDLVTDEGFAAELIGIIGEFNLKDAENLLRTGVHCIDFCDDLGYNTGMFISPRIYERLILPWHASLAELCHRHGAYVNMHSHGNINEIVPLLVEAGIDILNPVGPSDGMNLRELKAKYGAKITFLGGVSKYIGEMTPAEIEAHLREVVATGAPGGGFMLKTEGGIPTDMTEENFRRFLAVSRECRRRK